MGVIGASPAPRRIGSPSSPFSSIRPAFFRSRVLFAPVFRGSRDKSISAGRREARIRGGDAVYRFHAETAARSLRFRRADGREETEQKNVSSFFARSADTTRARIAVRVHRELTLRPQIGSAARYRRRGRAERRLARGKKYTPVRVARGKRARRDARLRVRRRLIMGTMEICTIFQSFVSRSREFVIISS